jgi:putative ABC transport system substrate-binding protein
MNRPGGNVMGVSFLSNSLVPKPLELLEELVPAARVVGLLANPANPNAESDIAGARAAATALRRRLHVTEIHSEDELDHARNALEPLMRSTSGGVRDHIVSSKIDRGPPQWR